MSVRIEVWRWIGPNPDVERYPEAEIDRAICRLDGDTPSDLTLARDDGSSVMAGGHGGRYVVTFAPLDGVENWHAETSIPQVVEELPDIVVGGQAADYPLSARLTFEEVQQAATWFSQYGGMCPSLTWVQD